MEKIKIFLQKNSIEFHEDFDLSNISTIKIGCSAKLLIFPKTERELERVALFLAQNKLPFRVFGNLSNVLFVGYINFPIIVTNKMNAELCIKNNLLQVPAGLTLSKLCDILKKQGLSGLEGVSNIPATVGGAIMCNAGAFGSSISSHLVSVRVLAGTKVLELDREQIKFCYHSSNLLGFIILSATFLFEKSNEYDIINLSNKYLYLRAQSQPSGLSLGSVFKKVGNMSAGFYIERCGLKGTRIGGVSISNKHANFFLNDGGGTGSDFLRLVALAKAEVLRQFAVALECEVETVGDKDETSDRLSYTLKKQPIFSRQKQYRGDG